MADRAFRTSCMDVVSIVFESSAGRARYATFVAAKDAGYNPKITDISVHRAKEFDHKRHQSRKCYALEYLTAHGEGVDDG